MIQMRIDSRRRRQLRRAQALGDQPDRRVDRALCAPGRHRHGVGEGSDARVATSRRAGREGGRSCACARNSAGKDGSYIRFDRNAAVLINDSKRAGRHPRVRAGGPRAARAPVHEDHLARARGAVEPWQDSRDSKKNDMVLVRAGKDRGKRGRVLQVLPDNNRVVVEGVGSSSGTRGPTRRRTSRAASSSARRRFTRRT